MVHKVKSKLEPHVEMSLGYPMQSVTLMVKSELQCLG